MWFRSICLNMSLIRKSHPLFRCTGEIACLWNKNKHIGNIDIFHSSYIYFCMSKKLKPKMLLKYSRNNILSYYIRFMNKQFHEKTFSFLPIGSINESFAAKWRQHIPLLYLFFDNSLKLKQNVFGGIYTFRVKTNSSWHILVELK